MRGFSVKGSGNQPLNRAGASPLSLACGALL